MPYKGIVKNNIVILEEAAKLSDGMRVIVTPEEEEKEPNFDADPFLYVDEWAPVPPEDAPKDLAHQHNHYLYGTKKL